jgi:hypothetical protein
MKRSFIIHTMFFSPRCFEVLKKVVNCVLVCHSWTLYFLESFSLFFLNFFVTKNKILKLKIKNVKNYKEQNNKMDTKQTLIPEKQTLSIRKTIGEKKKTIFFF